MDARLIVDPPARGDWNMAVDEALLDSTGHTGVPVLRFYQWSEPTLSLGYFQSHEDRRLHPPSANCPLVRRSTGGGAIMHDRELTYSLTIPTAFPQAKPPQSLYQNVHRALLGVFESLGVQGELCLRPARPAPASERFLCFQRRAEGDLLLGQSKVCGSAQRRHMNALLQHGSILLGRSSCAPELPGWREFTGSAPSAEELAREIWTRLSQLLGLTWGLSAMTVGETALCETLCKDRFAHPAWTFRR